MQSGTNVEVEIVDKDSFPGIKVYQEPDRNRVLSRAQNGVFECVHWRIDADTFKTAESDKVGILRERGLPDRPASHPWYIAFF